MPAAIDLLIEPEWLIPIEPAGLVLRDHAVAVHNGRIVGIEPAARAAALWQPRQHVQLPGQVLIPGLVNAHTHAAMALLRGHADDLPLMRWLNERIWPAEGRLMSAAFVHDGTLLAAWEMLRGGVTCFNDMYFFPEAAAQAATAAGIRAVLGITLAEFPSAYGRDAEDYLTRGLAARDAWSDHPLLSFALAPHAPYTVSDRSFERVATLAAQLDVPIHIHVHETGDEIEDGLKRFGMRPLRRLERLGLLGPHLLAVHAVHVTEDEIELLARTGCAVIHCPTSNMKLASGISPATAMAAAGLRIALGSDGAASNNRLDMLQEMRHAGLLAKVVSGDATALDAHRLLRMATLDGASALGLGDDIGTITPGKWADLCAVRLDHWLCRPCSDPASQLIYVADRSQVSHVWVAGSLRIHDGEPVNMPPGRLIELAESWHNRIGTSHSATTSSS
jgi:5-methylthioadenosine/S-adenosylhomocysteine deaminase